MRIDKVEIDGFGKFNNCSYTFSDGVNLIYGKNESGKSTICEFILAMFYGLPNKSKQTADGLPSRQKYAPWNGESFGGRVYFTNDDGRKLVIERSFKATKRGDRAVLRDADTWEEVGDCENAGEKYFGLSRESFLKTLYIKSFGADSLKTDDGEIMSRLSNLETSGDEDISYSKIINEIEKDMFSLKTKTGRGGKITAIDDKITALTNERTMSLMTYSALENESQTAENLKESAKKKEEETKQLEKQYAKALQHEKYLSQKKVEETKKVLEDRLNEQLRRKKELETNLENIDNDDIKVSREEIAKTRELETKKLLISEKIQSLQAEKENAKDNKNIFAVLLAVFGVVLGAIGVFTNIILSIFGALLIVLGIALAFVSKASNNKNKKSKQNELDKIQKELKTIETELLGIYARYNVTISDELSALFISSNDKQERTNQLKKQLDECMAEIENLEKSVTEEVDKEEYSKDIIEYDGESADKIFEMINLIKSEIRQMCDHANEISLRIAKETAEIRAEDEINAELKEAQEERAELEKRHAALTCASEWLNQAHAEIKNNFAPRLNKKASSLLSYLTSEKYEDMRTNDSFSINLKSEGGEIVGAEFMSRGTYDLLYIALRFASVSVLTDGNIPPVILDDAFSQLDDTRLIKVAELIEKDEEFSQVFLFTCHENYKEILKNCNLIDLA